MLNQPTGPSDPGMPVPGPKPSPQFMRGGSPNPILDPPPFPPK